MYRIIKRIVRTVTTVTLLVRWETNSQDQEALEIPIILPASHSLTEEVVERKNKPNKRKKSKPILNKGDKS